MNTKVVFLSMYNSVCAFNVNARTFTTCVQFVRCKSITFTLMFFFSGGTFCVRFQQEICIFQNRKSPRCDDPRTDRSVSKESLSCGMGCKVHLPSTLEYPRIHHWLHNLLSLPGSRWGTTQIKIRRYSIDTILSDTISAYIIFHY